MPADGDPELRAASAFALGKLKHEPAIDRLSDMLRDGAETDKVRMAAAWTLGWTNDPRAVAPLITALNDDSPGVRAKAAWAMGKRKVDSSAPRLNELTKDGDIVVRQYAAEALPRLPTAKLP